MAGQKEGEVEKCRPRLFSYFRSSCSWRVRVAMQLAGIEADQVAVHLVKGGGEQHREEYAAMNPMEQVPSLEIDGLVLTQSVAIMEYIADRHPEAGLLPKGLAARARVRQVTELISSGIQPSQNLSILQKLSSDGKIGDKEKEWARHFITVGFRALEQLLSSTCGLCCVGDTVTMADCCLVPQVYNAQRFSVDMSLFPTISRLDAALNLRPEFQAAHPSAQPDCPPELK